MLGAIPCGLGILLANMMGGNTELRAIPEDYTPKEWEYFPNPITMCAVWLCASSCVRLRSLLPRRPPAHTHVSKLNHMGTTRTMQGTGDVCPSIIRAWDTPIDSLSPNYCVFIPVYLFSPF